MDLFKKIKEALAGSEKRKIVENSIIVIIIGVIILIAGNSFFSGSGGGGDNGKNQPNPSDLSEETEPISSVIETYTDEETRLELRLSSILKNVKGVGDVDVMITYTTGTENIHAFDTRTNESMTAEDDGAGGNRSISQIENTSSIVFEDSTDGGKAPVVIKDVKPVVKGVMVVAEGAGNPSIREKVLSSVQVLMDIPLHKIQVVEMEK